MDVRILVLQLWRRKIQAFDQLWPAVKIVSTIRSLKHLVMGSLTRWYRDLVCSRARPPDGVMVVLLSVKRPAIDVVSHTCGSAHDEEPSVAEEVRSTIPFHVVRLSPTSLCAHDLGVGTTHFDDIELAVAFHVPHDIPLLWVSLSSYGVLPARSGLKSVVPHPVPGQLLDLVERGDIGQSTCTTGRAAGRVGRSIDILS